MKLFTLDGFAIRHFRPFPQVDRFDDQASAMNAFNLLVAKETKGRWVTTGTGDVLTQWRKADGTLKAEVRKGSHDTLEFHKV